MFELICKTLIADYKNVSDAKVREKYGVVFSIIAILLNIILVLVKLFVAFATGLVSIKADALNNLSDVGSNVAALFGFRLANKRPDADHPYGHGRYEYLSGMVIAILILLMAILAFKEAIEKIFNPIEINCDIVPAILLVVSIMIKLFMAYINKKAGKNIESDTLKAAGQDSINDAIMTSATLLGVVLFLLFKINIDAYIGLIVSLFVFKSGIEIFSDVMSTILGKAPDAKLIKEIEDYVIRNYDVLGIHDLLLHDYGSSNRYMTFHAEVDYRVSILETHDMIDNIENDIIQKYGILTTIHMDPIVTDDQELFEIKEKVIKIITDINKKYSLHDFRMVKGNTHSNLVFDLVIPVEDNTDYALLKNKISNEVKKIDNKYNCVIKIEYSVVSTLE